MNGTPYLSSGGRAKAQVENGSKSLSPFLAALDGVVMCSLKKVGLDRVICQLCRGQRTMWPHFFFDFCCLAHQCSLKHLTTSLTLSPQQAGRSKSSNIGTIRVGETLKYKERPNVCFFFWKIWEHPSTCWLMTTISQHGITTKKMFTKLVVSPIINYFITHRIHVWYIC